MVWESSKPRYRSRCISAYLGKAHIAPTLRHCDWETCIPKPSTHRSSNPYQCCLSSHLQIAKTVAENIFSFDAKFWMRVAMKNDTAANTAEREALGNMADTVMVLVREMVKSSEAQLQGSSKILQVRICLAKLPTFPRFGWLRPWCMCHADNPSRTRVYKVASWLAVKYCNAQSCDSTALACQRQRLHCIPQPQNPKPRSLI